MNKKGQALVEFIIILPIFIMLLLAAFDMVKIMQTKMNLENTLEELILDENTILDNEINYIKDVKDNTIIYKLSIDVDIMSPFVTIVTDDKYRVTVERTLYAK
ncbi:MAG: hypothetical protein E7167_04225 [Firmicutes bacterium]|nr:hypothetical protein [Bacillota bacterium]